MNIDLNNTNEQSIIENEDNINTEEPSNENTAKTVEQNDKIYNLLGEIYKTLGNEKLSKKILEPNSSLEAINSIKDKLTGIYKIT